MPDQNNIQPTPLQIKAVNNVLNGESNIGKAMQDAGYSEKTSLNPKQNFVDSRGVQTYLQALDEKSRKKFNMSVTEKALETYFDALDAQKVVPVRMLQSEGKVLVKSAGVPDHDIRMKAADRILSLNKYDSRIDSQQNHNPLNSPYVIETKKKLQEFLESQ